MTEIKKEILLPFLEWYENLNASDKVSVWSKDGQYSGLFNMDAEQLVDKYIDRVRKQESKNKIVCPHKVDGSCPLPNIHCIYPECEHPKR